MYSNVFVDFVETHAIFHHTFVSDIEQKALRILWVSSWFVPTPRKGIPLQLSGCRTWGFWISKVFCAFHIGCIHLWADTTGCGLSFSLSDDTSKLSTLPARCKAINRSTVPYNHAEIHFTSHSWRFISLRARTNPFETVPSGGCGDAGPNRCSKIYWIDMQSMFLHLQHWRFFR